MKRSPTKVLPAMKHQHKSAPGAMAHLNELLDEALNQTFPASDPIAIAVEFEAAENQALEGLGVALPSGGVHPTAKRVKKGPVE